MKPDDPFTELLAGGGLVAIICILAVFMFVHWWRHRHRHRWGVWNLIHASDNSVAGRYRMCGTCPDVQEEYYPDGH